MTFSDTLPGHTEPTDLTRYFEEVEHASLHLPQDHSQQLLTRAEARHLSQQMHFHPLMQQLGGLILDDVQTSNHHLYVSTGPLRGAVCWLSHDGASRIVYASLSDFLSAAIAARAEHQLLEDRHPELSPIAEDQHALGHWILTMLEEADADVRVPALIPSLDLTDFALLHQLASHEDFYIAEAIALEICRRPHKALAEVAQTCAQHPHPQAAKAGGRARGMIRGLRE